MVTPWKDKDQWYAPMVCAKCGERLGWIGVSENLKDYTFVIEDANCTERG